MTPEARGELLMTYAKGPAVLKAALAKYPKESLDYSPGPGKWSIQDIVFHLAEAELHGYLRGRTIIAESGAGIMAFDQDRWASSYKGIPAAEALATFTALRRWNLLLARTALPHAALKPVHHPERGDMTFTTLLETMAGHDINHLRQLQTLAGFGG